MLLSPPHTVPHPKAALLMENDLQGVIWKGVQTQASSADAVTERRVSTLPGREKAGGDHSSCSLDSAAGKSPHFPREPSPSAGQD